MKKDPLPSHYFFEPPLSKPMSHGAPPTKNNIGGIEK